MSILLKQWEFPFNIAIPGILRPNISIFYFGVIIFIVQLYTLCHKTILLKWRKRTFWIKIATRPYTFVLYSWFTLQILKYIILYQTSRKPFELENLKNGTSVSSQNNIFHIREKSEHPTLSSRFTKISIRYTTRFIHCCRLVLVKQYLQEGKTEDVTTENHGRSPNNSFSLMANSMPT